MKIRTVPIDEVKPYERNPRRNEAAVAEVQHSLVEFGWRQPIVVDETMVIIAHNTRRLAAHALRVPTVPFHVADGCVCTTSLTPYPAPLRSCLLLPHGGLSVAPRHQEAASRRGS